MRDLEKILIAEKRASYSDDIVNDFTKELDRCVASDNGYFQNYIYPEKIKRGENKHHIAFRYPGATRGYIEVNNDNVIVDIAIYDSSDIYKEDTLEIMKKFIGYVIEF